MIRQTAIHTPRYFLEDAAVIERKNPAATLIKTKMSLRGVMVQRVRLDPCVDRVGVLIGVGGTDEYFSDIDNVSLLVFSGTLTSQALMLEETSLLEGSWGLLSSSDI